MLVHSEQLVEWIKPEWIQYGDAFQPSLVLQVFAQKYSAPASNAELSSMQSHHTKLVAS
jgi:hypothetical protein